MDQAEAESGIDVYQCVNKLRQQRTNMVQTLVSSTFGFYIFFLGYDLNIINYSDIVPRTYRIVSYTFCLLKAQYIFIHEVMADFYLSGYTSINCDYFEEHYDLLCTNGEYANTSKLAEQFQVGKVLITLLPPL